MASHFLTMINLVIVFIFNFTFLCVSADVEGFYAISAIDIDGKYVSLSKYSGTVSLVVNVASKCGLTKSNYEELSQLQSKFGPRGFQVLAFPCNQFNQQEPGSNEEVKTFAIQRGANYPLFAKLTVNEPMCEDGGLEVCSSQSSACCSANNSVYTYLKSVLKGKIDWNFAKFLIGRDGQILQRYKAQTPPLSISNDIDLALDKDYPFVD